MTITKLEWNELTPDTESYQDVFKQSALTEETVFLLGDTQPRLQYALEQLLHPMATSRFMLAKAPEEDEYLKILAEAVSALQPEEFDVVGGDYQVNGATITLTPAQNTDANFAGKHQVVIADWVEAEQLFGCLRQFNNQISLQPGLVHQANGGTLIISLHILLAQPLLWMRLKTMVTRRRFDWVAFDESRPLPVSVPSLPLDLRGFNWSPGTLNCPPRQQMPGQY